MLLNQFIRRVIQKKITSATVGRTNLRGPVQLYYSTEEKSVPKPNEKLVNVTFLKANGERIKVKGKVGDSLLDVVVNNNVDLDGFGACEGTLTCSTCHLIFSEKDYKDLPEKPSDEELDMLDLAYDLTDTSRLGCQIILSEKLDGLEVKVATQNNDLPPPLPKMPPIIKNSPNQHISVITLKDSEKT